MWEAFSARSAPGLNFVYLLPCARVRVAPFFSRVKSASSFVSWPLGPLISSCLAFSTFPLISCRHHRPPLPLCPSCAVAGYNTLLYMLACLPAAISTVYKQHALEQHGRPVDAHQLSLGVTAFEVVFIALAAPAAYQLQVLYLPCLTYVSLHHSNFEHALVPLKALLLCSCRKSARMPSSGCVSHRAYLLKLVGLSLSLSLYGIPQRAYDHDAQKLNIYVFFIFLFFITFGT